MKRLALLFLLFSFFSGFSQRQQEAKILCNQAYRHYQKNELGLARHLVDQSISLLPTAESRYLSGLIFESERKPLRAVAEYEATVIMNPDSKEAYFKKALIYLSEGNPRNAINDFTFLINSYDHTEETTSVFFQIDESGGSQNKIMTFNMLEAQLYHYRGQSFQEMESFDQALDDYNTAIRLEPTPDYFISRGLLHMRLRKSASAVMDFREAVQIDPDNHVAWYNLALVDDNLSLPPSLTIGADFAPTLSLLASKEMDKRNYRQAIKYLNQAISINPRDALSLINRGRAKIKINQYANARADFVNAQKIDPKRSESLYLIGNSFFYSRRYKEALAYYNQYLAIDTENGNIWYNAAMCHFEIGNKNEACHFLQLASSNGMSKANSMMARYCR